ncbi:MAG: hypothetical protein IT288_17185 [Bdellovibrionales bacterium]|nr:hypothetical protein [Bdellovibrionales bacterium]
MKALLFATVALAASLSIAVSAEELALKKSKLPTAVMTAVSEAYDLSRGNYDTGGISKVVVYKNPKNLSYYAIVRNLLGSYQLDTSENACVDVKLDACARLILAHSEDVKANFQPSAFTDFIAEMKGWSIEEADFVAKVSTIEGFVLSTLGDGYKTFALGYDDVADVFDLILISKDRKTVVVVSGDYGA